MSVPAVLSAAGVAVPDDRNSTAGLVFDQIGRVLPGTSLPAPDSFAADAERIANLPPLPDPSGVFSTLQAAKLLGSNPLTMLAAQPAALMAAAAGARYEARIIQVGNAYLDAGVQTRIWRQGGWTRIDYSRLQSATITKPELGQEIVLNLAARTYVEKRVPLRDNIETYTVSAADEVRFEYSRAPVTRELSPTILAGVPAHGYETEAAFDTSRAIGRCASGAHSVKVLEYVAVDLADPDAPGATSADPSFLARETCLPSSGASHREPGRLVLFRATAVTAGIPAGDMTYVLERGNLRSLSAADAAQFSVPDNFTRAQLPEDRKP